MSDMDDKERSRERSRRDRPTRFSEGSRDRSNDRGGREPRSMKSSNNRVYVSNIPYEFRWQDMKDMFRNQVGAVQFVELFVDDNDKPKGCGIVEFADASSVKKCVDIMQRHEVNGRKLVIRDDTGNVRDKHGLQISGGGKRNRDNDRYRDDRPPRDQMGGGGGMPMRKEDPGQWGNTYGLSPNFLESLSIDPPLVSKVFVANLEYNIDKKKLKDVFRLAGKVIRVDIPMDKDGRSRGFAVVEFDHPVEAVQAISMLHNQVLYDRPMTVRMDRANETFKLPDGLKTVGMGLGPNGEALKNVAHNLPSLSGAGGAQQPAGAGLLGAVPNNQLQLATALSSLTGQQVLQAAGLAGNLLGNGLGSADLSSLVASAAQGQQQQQLAMAPNVGSSGSGGSMTFGRGGAGGGDSYNGLVGQQSMVGGGQGYNTSSLGGASRGFQQQQQQSNSTGFGSSGFGSSDSRLGYSGVSSSMMRAPANERGSGDSKSFTRKVLVSNLPPNTSYKVLHEKFTEYGDILAFEEKGPGNVMVTYGSDWQAERAIKNLDRARIDSRIIEARLYF